MGARRRFALVTITLFLTCGQRGVLGDAKCPSHCDSEDRYVSSFSCYGEKPYCCGNSTTMFCCSDWYSDISQLYTDQCFCNTSNCLYRNWEAIASVITMVTLFAIVLFCCCVNQCHRGKPLCHRSCPAATSAAAKCCPSCCCGPASTHSDSSGERTGRSDDEVLSGERGLDLYFDPVRGQRDRYFDPAAPYAFSPPDYEAVCKAPPSYEELLEQGAQACTNHAYVTDNDVIESSTSASDHAIQSSSHHGNDSHDSSSISNGSHNNGLHCNDSHGNRAHSLNVRRVSIPSVSRTISRHSNRENCSHSNEQSTEHSNTGSGSHRISRSNSLAHIRNPVIDSRRSLSPRVGGASLSRHHENDPVWADSVVLEVDESPPPYTEDMRGAGSQPANHVPDTVAVLPQPTNEKEDVSRLDLLNQASVRASDI